MGAVKFIVGGADVMRPGITEISEGIEKNEIILVVDENARQRLRIEFDDPGALGRSPHDDVRNDGLHRSTAIRG